MLPVAFNTCQCATQQLDLLANVTSSTSISAHLPGIPTLMVSCLCSTQLEMCEIILEWRRSIVAWSTPVRTCMACLGVPRGWGAYQQNRPNGYKCIFYWGAQHGSFDKIYTGPNGSVGDSNLYAFCPTPEPARSRRINSHCFSMGVLRPSVRKIGWSLNFRTLCRHPLLVQRMAELWVESFCCRKRPRQ